MNNDECLFSVSIKNCFALRNVEIEEGRKHKQDLPIDVHKDHWYFALDDPDDDEIPQLNISSDESDDDGMERRRRRTPRYSHDSILNPNAPNPSSSNHSDGYESDSDVVADDPLPEIPDIDLVIRQIKWKKTNQSGCNSRTGGRTGIHARGLIRDRYPPFPAVLRERETPEIRLRRIEERRNEEQDDFNQFELNLPISNSNQEEDEVRLEDNRGRRRRRKESESPSHRERGFYA